MADAYLEPDEKGYHTYNDYLSWEGPDRYQIIHGDVFMMASPSVEHQSILTELIIQFGSWLRGKPCWVFTAPLDVRLFPEEDNSDDTVVQPDLLVVCDKAKLGKRSVNGSPDLAIEIISPSTLKKELFLKFKAYLEAGVRECWIIEPEQKIVQVHVYENGHFISSGFQKDDVISSVVLRGLTVDLQTLWDAAGSAAAEQTAP